MPKFLSAFRLAMACVFVGIGSAGLRAQTAVGDLDTTFNSTADKVVNAIAVQADGKIIIGGAFSTVGGQTRKGVARLETTGTTDTTFANPDINGTVTGLAIQPDGKVIAVGKFTTAATVSHVKIVRLNTDGTVDATFTTGLDGDAYAVAVTKEGKIWVGGDFGLVRLNSSGVIDTPAGSHAIAGSVYAVAVQQDQKVVIAGKFGTVGTTARRNIARIGTDGKLDTTFKANTDNTSDSDGAGTKSVASSAFALGIQADGKILVGGYFISINGTTRNYLARVSTTGAVDKTFNPNPNGAVYAFAIDSNGDIVMGGEFTALGGVSRTCIARVQPTGTVDNTFIKGGGQIAGSPTASVSPYVFALAQSLDGKVLAGGYFTKIGGNNATRIARLVNSTTAGVTVHAVLNEDPNSDANADSDSLDIRFVLNGTAPAVDAVGVQDIATPATPVDLGVATRFIENGISVWKLRKTGEKRAVGDQISLRFLFFQTQNAAGSSFYGFDATPTILATPKIEFTQTSSSTVDEIDSLADGNTNLPEPDSNLTLGITITGTIPYTTVIPITFGSTSTSEATKESDYTSNLTRLVLTTSDTAGSASPYALTLKQDKLVEGDEIISVTLGDAESTNFLPLGTNKTHTVTIKDDDFAPTITTPPQGGLYYTGTTATLTVGYTANGSSSKVQWWKNTSPISGATSPTLKLTNLQLSHAGEYKARVSNDNLDPDGGHAYSDVGPETVAVVKATPAVHAVASGTNLTLTTTAAGLGLTYQWYLDNMAILTTTNATADEPALVLSNVQTANNGTYRCVVSLGSSSLSAGDHKVAVVTGAPSFPPMGTFPAGRVAVPYDQPIPIDMSAGLSPSSTTVTGLPPGLTYNPGTLRVTGIPTKAGSYTVSMKATNALGTASAQRVLLINALPPTVLGSYAVRLAIGALPNDIGGRVDFSTLSDGRLTGSFVIKGIRRSFTGRLVGTSTPVYTAVVALPGFEGDSSPDLELHFDVPGANYVDATLHHTSGGWTGWGWRQSWTGGTATTRAGRHNYGSTASGTCPPGSIAGSFVVSASGGVTLSGTLADGTQLTGTTLLGPAGEVLLYQVLYNKRGAILGGDIPPTIYPTGTPPGIDGEIQWKKYDTTVLTPATRDYATGFDGILTLMGNSYAAPPANTRVMNLTGASPNLRIDLSLGALGAPITVDAVVSTTNTVQIITAPNSSNIKLTLNASNGTFTGSFVSNGLTVPFKGTFWNTATSGTGHGWFLQKNGTNADYLSGLIQLTPLP